MCEKQHFFKDLLYRHTLYVLHAIRNKLQDQLYEHS
jgi:hypothetical protein